MTIAAQFQALKYLTSSDETDTLFDTLPKEVLSNILSTVGEMILSSPPPMLFEETRTAFTLLVAADNFLGVQMLLTYDHHHYRVLSNLRERAITTAAKLGAFEMTRVLLFYPQQDLSFGVLVETLANAVKRGHADIVKLLVKQMSEEVILAQAGYLMFLIDEFDHRAVLLPLLPYLLKRVRPQQVVDELADEDLAKALVIVAGLGSITALQAILARDKRASTIHYIDKIRALQIARKHHHLHLKGAILDALDVDIAKLLDPPPRLLMRSFSTETEEREVLEMDALFAKLTF